MFAKYYNFFLIFYLSFFSRKIYNIICYRLNGLFISYVLFLSIIYSASIASLWYYKTQTVNLDFPRDESLESSEKDYKLLDVISQIPQIRIDNGIVSTDAIQPFYIRDPATDQDVIIIDTTGQINSLENINANILLTRKELFLKFNQNEQAKFLVNSLVSALIGIPHSITIDQNIILEILKEKKNTLKWVIPFVFLPITCLIYLILLLGQTLFSTIFIFVIIKSFGKNLNFDSCFRIVTIATSPVIFLQVIDLFFGIPVFILNSQFVIFATSIFYLFFAITSCNKEKPI